MRLDTVVALFASLTGFLVSFVAVTSPDNVYAYIASPIVAYFATLGHYPETRHARGKPVLDALLALILLSIVVYRSYVFITTHR